MILTRQFAAATVAAGLTLSLPSLPAAHASPTGPETHAVQAGRVTQAAAARVSATIAPVSLPELAGRVQKVVATVTTDHRIGWSARVQIVHGDVIRVLDVAPPAQRLVLNPGTHRLLLGTTRLFDRAGRHHVDLRILDPDTGATSATKHLSVVVRGRLAKPQSLRVVRQGGRVKVGGTALPFPAGVTVEVGFRRSGQHRFRTITKARINASGIWTATVTTRQAGALRFRVVSPYGVSPYTQPRRVAGVR